MEAQAQCYGISVDHNRTGRDVVTTASLRVSRGLKSGKLDIIPMDEGELIKLISQASNALAILTGVRL